MIVFERCEMILGSFRSFFMQILLLKRGTGDSINKRRE